MAASKRSGDKALPRAGRNGPAGWIETLTGWRRARGCAGLETRQEPLDRCASYRSGKPFGARRLRRHASKGCSISGIGRGQRASPRRNAQAQAQAQAQARRRPGQGARRYASSRSARPAVRDGASSHRERQLDRSDRPRRRGAATGAGLSVLAHLECRASWCTGPKNTAPASRCQPRAGPPAQKNRVFLLSRYQMCLFTLAPIGSDGEHRGNPTSRPKEISGPWTPRSPPP